ncbi:hypothetical protein ACHAPQ_011201 [Fusarium lateritium]
MLPLLKLSLVLLLEQNVGELVTNDSNQPLFQMKRLTTNWFHALVDIDDQLLSGFHPGTVARIGLGPCAGLKVLVQITAGKFAQAMIHFKFVVRNGDRCEKFTELMVPFAELPDDITLNDIFTEDAKAMETLETFVADDPSELAPQPNATDVLRELLDDADLTVPARDIQRVSPTVRHMRVDIDWSNVFPVDNAEFDRVWDMHPDTMRGVVSAVRSRFRRSLKNPYSKASKERFY